MVVLRGRRVCGGRDEGSSRRRIADGPRFEVRSYAVAGGTVFRPSDVDAMLAPFLGQSVGFAQIEAARAALQSAYHQRGFGAAQVTIPEQELSGGTVTLEVLEPKLTELILQGARHHDDENIRRSLPALSEGSMPNTEAVARQLSLANENSSKQTDVTFRSARKPGEIAATVSVTDNNPLRRFLTVDNSGTPSTGTHRISVGLQHANLFNRDHVATLQFTTSIEKPSKSPSSASVTAFRCMKAAIRSIWSAAFPASVPVRYRC
jgi:hemolysin activation/secretion protein